MQDRSIGWLPSVCAWTEDHMHENWGLNRSVGVCPDRESNLQPFSYRMTPTN